MVGRRYLRVRLPLLSSILAVASACASHAFIAPAVPATPAEDGPAAWAEATAVCRDVHAIRAALGLTGRIGSQQIRGLASARIGVVADDGGNLALEARVSGQLVFKIGGTAARSTLLIRINDEWRVVTAPAEDIVEALIGVRLGPARLVRVVSGCGSISVDAVRIERRGEVLQATTSDSLVYLTRRGAWQVRAAEFDGVQADYRVFAAGLPKSLVVRTLAGRSPVVSLSLNVQSVEPHPVFESSMFSVAVDENATPLSLADLRASGPLGESSAQ